MARLQAATCWSRGPPGRSAFTRRSSPHLAGARSLVATVSGAAKAEIARAAGVPVVVNYSRENVAERVLASDAKARRRPHFGGRLRRQPAPPRSPSCASRVIGTYASRGAERPTLALLSTAFWQRRGALYSVLADPGRAQGGRHPRPWPLGRGSSCHPTPTMLPLADIAAAHELVESGTVVGKVMLSL